MRNSIKNNRVVIKQKGDEGKFTSIFENSLNAILLGIPDGTILEANNAAIEMFGYSLQELKTLGRGVIFDSSDPKMIAALKIREITGKSKGELIGIRKNGERFPCEFSSAIFITETGERRTSTVLNDITERKKSEEEVNLLLNNTQESFVLINLKLEVVSFNKQFKNLYKIFYNKDVEKGHYILNFAQEDRKEKVKDIYERVFKGEIIEDEIEVPNNEKGLIVFSIQYKPALDNYDNLIGAFVTCRDITQQKIVQLKLNEKNELFEILTSKIPAAIYQFEIRPDGKMCFPYISEGIEKINPNLNRELLKEDASSGFASVHPDDLEKLLISIETSKNNLTDWDFEYRSIVDQGKIIWTKGMSTPEKKEDGTIVWYGYFQDITEQKNNNEKIRISNERYNIIAKATNDTIWDWEMVTNEVKWNQGISGIFGYKQERTNMNYDWWVSKIHPEDANSIKEHLEFCIKNKVNRWENEYRFCCADGTYRHIYDRGFLVIEDTIPIRMIGAMQDITKRKQEEYHLKLLESVIINTNDAVIITEAEPIEEPGPKIIYVNEAFTRMTGYSKEEVIDKSPRFLRGLNSDKQELGRLSEAIRKFEPCEITTINYKKNGEEFWVNLSVSPVSDEKGKVTHWISIERDITQKKQYELEREQIISELSQINKDLKQFSYVTSHNLRAPIANLLGLTSLIDRYKIPNKSLKQILDGIKQSALMFDETVKDLSQVLIIKDQTNIIKEELSLVSIVDKSLAQLSITVDDNDVKINYEFKGAPKVLFTGSYLESIFINLFTNALKYKSHQRKLKIDITSEDTQEYVVVTFKDNGIGIDVEKYREKLFKLYQRFHGNSEGKGLGLYLIKSQMEALSGKIDVESVVGKGTTFILKFKKYHKE